MKSLNIISFVCKLSNFQNCVGFYQKISLLLLFKKVTMSYPLNVNQLYTAHLPKQSLRCNAGKLNYIKKRSSSCWAKSVYSQNDTLWGCEDCAASLNLLRPVPPAFSVSSTTFPNFPENLSCGSERETRAPTYKWLEFGPMCLPSALKRDTHTPVLLQGSVVRGKWKRNTWLWWRVSESGALIASLLTRQPHRQKETRRRRRCQNIRDSARGSAAKLFEPREQSGWWLMCVAVFSRPGTQTAARHWMDDWFEDGRSWGWAKCAGRQTYPTFFVSLSVLLRMNV